MIAALDIGGTKMSAALFHGDRILERRVAPTPTDGAEALADAAASLLRDWSYSAIGVATTGYVADGRVFAVNRTTLSGWDGFPLEGALKSRLNFTGTMLVLNDATAAAWAESAMRQPRPARMAFVTVSTGVGGGAVLDGKLLESPGGIAGHFGHMRIADAGLCGCGRIGCVEAIASGTAIARAASGRIGSDLTAAEVFQRADTNPVCRDVIETSARTIAELSGNLRMLLDIDTVVIGGSVGLANGYIERVRDHTNRLPVLAQATIERAICADDAGLMGVALRLSGTVG